MDFLSALTHYGPCMAETPVIVLNSVVMKHRAVETIQRLGVSTVHLYLDHDGPGQELAAYFRAQLAGVELFDQSGLYAGHKDFNEWLSARRAQARSR